MATVAISETHAHEGERFFERLALAMALTVISGFSLNVLLGRSTFLARPLVHAHAITFMIWVGLFVTQSRLATRGPIELHRRLGWFAAFWTLWMVVMGSWLTTDMVVRGISPFFFEPQYFLIANIMGVLCFAGLVWWAVRMRRQTDWHRRLQMCAMAAILGPAFGRLLPMPLLIPYAFDTAVVAGLVFPLIGMIRDKRALGHVHPAWWCGVLAVIVALLFAHGVASSSIGDAIYAGVTKGHPGETVPGNAYPPPPPMPG
jgi:hypothetical protein